MNHDRTPAEHWRRFRQLVAGMTLLGLMVAAGALWWLQATGSEMHIHFVIAVTLAVVLSLTLAGVLMGLVFVSNNSGHDAEVSGPDSRD